MATTATPKSSGTSRAGKKPTARTVSPTAHSNNGSDGHAKSTARARATNARATDRSRTAAMSELPTWVGVVASVVGAGLVAGYYASQKGWFSRVAEWSENHAAAFADGETDEDNFDQTRSAGIGAMRDDHDDWDDVDDISDASFPASDPPSFNPGTA